MLSQLQAQAVQLLDGARQEVGAVDGELVPRVVRPYGGELLKRAQLAAIVPAVFVELSHGTLGLLGDAGTLRGSHVLTLVVVARNLAGWEAAAHDGARLTDWTIRVLRDAHLRIGRAQIKGAAYTRLLSDVDLWAARLDLALQETA